MVPTEASAQAVRAFRGARGPVASGAGRARSSSAVAAMTFYLDVEATYAAVGRLAQAVAPAREPGARPTPRWTRSGCGPSSTSSASRPAPARLARRARRRHPRARRTRGPGGRRPHRASPARARCGSPSVRRPSPHRHRPARHGDPDRPTVDAGHGRRRDDRVGRSRCGSPGVGDRVMAAVTPAAPRGRRPGRAARGAGGLRGADSRRRQPRTGGDVADERAHRAAGARAAGPARGRDAGGQRRRRCAGLLRDRPGQGARPAGDRRRQARGRPGWGFGADVVVARATLPTRSAASPPAGSRRHDTALLARPRSARSATAAGWWWSAAGTAARPSATDRGPAGVRPRGARADRLAVGAAPAGGGQARPLRVAGEFRPTARPRPSGDGRRWPARPGPDRVCVAGSSWRLWRRARSCQHNDENRATRIRRGGSPRPTS